MKRNFLFAALLSVFAVSVANADILERNRIITKEQLPTEAKQFIDKHFAGSKISYIKEEHDFLEKTFEVVFSDASKVEFSRDGVWKEIDCRNAQVPSAVVPDEIERYIAEHYGDKKILQIERDRYDYEVRTSNRLELTFDKNLNIIDIDD